MEITGSLPRLTEADYRAVIESYVRAASEIPNVLAILRVGGRTPGISDLDLLIIVDEAFSRADTDRLSTATAGGEGVAYHSPLFVPRALFEKMAMLILTIDPEMVYASARFDGKVEDIEPLSRELALCYLLETSMYRNFFATMFAFDWHANIRKVLTHLWKMKRNVDLLRFLGLEVPDRAESVAAEVTAIRKRWGEDFTEPSKRDVLSLFEEARGLWPVLFSMALREISKDVRDHYDRKVVVTEANERLVMDPGVTSLSVEVSTLNLLGRQRRKYMTLAPISLLYHLDACGFPSGMSRNPLGECRYREAMAERSAVAARRSELAERTGSSTMPIGSFPLLPRPGRATLWFDRARWALTDLRSAS